MAIDARPTVDAPDDDPYLWLEEVEGGRAAAWVERAERPHPGGLRRTGVEQDAATLAAIFDRPDKIPFIGRRGAVALQFLERCGASARPVAAHHARELPRRRSPNGRSCSTSTRWPRPRARTGSGAAPRRGPARTTARSCACRAAAAMPSVLREFDLGDARRSCPDGFVLPEAKGGASWLDATRCCCRQRAGRRRSPPRAMPARCGCGGAAPSPSAGAGAVRGAGDQHGGVGRRRPRPIPDERVWFYDADRLLRRGRLDLATAPGQDAARPADRRCGPTSQHGWLAVKPRNAWTVGGKTWPGRQPARHPARRLPGRRPRLHAAVRARPSAARCKGFFWNAGRLVLSILDNLAAGVRGADARPTRLGARRRSPACRESAWSTSGRSTSRPSEAERRPAGQRAGSADAALADADRARAAAPTRAEALAADLRRRRAWW